MSEASITLLPHIMPLLKQKIVLFVPYAQGQIADVPGAMEHEIGPRIGLK
jgi:hypothetical protein